MGLEKIREIQEVYNPTDANKYLKQKYKLLKILQTRHTTNDFEEVRPCYILGKS